MSMDKTELLKKAEWALVRRLEDIERTCREKHMAAADLYLEEYYGAVGMLFHLGLLSQQEYDTRMEEGLRRYHAARSPEEAE